MAIRAYVGTFDDYCSSTVIEHLRSKSGWYRRNLSGLFPTVKWKNGDMSRIYISGEVKPVSTSVYNLIYKSYRFLSRRLMLSSLLTFPYKNVTPSCGTLCLGEKRALAYCCAKSAVGSFFYNPTRQKNYKRSDNPLVEQERSGLFGNLAKSPSMRDADAHC